MPITPEVLWAQRSSATDETRNYVILTVKIVDATNVKIDLKPDHIEVSANSSADDYHVHIDFFEPIVPEKSSHRENGHEYIFKLQKAENKEEFWPRLTKEKLKYHYIKTDFDKWVDEDEQDDAPADDDMDMANMFGGAGGAGGMPDMASMFGGAGGAGGMPAGFDLEALKKQMGDMSDIADMEANIDNDAESSGEE